MAMIDIDLSEFSTTDLIDELIKRLDRKMVSAHEKNEIQLALEEALKSKFQNTMQVKISNLNDIYKMEHISKIWNKYSPQQIENALPE